MNKREKSIRHELKFYGPKIRAGHMKIPGETTGWMDEKDFYLASAHADVDVHAGIVTDIRLYRVGDAKAARDYYGQTLEFTDILYEYIRDPEATWDELIGGICDAVSDFIRE